MSDTRPRKVREGTVKPVKDRVPSRGGDHGHALARCLALLVVACAASLILLVAAANAYAADFQYPVADVNTAPTVTLGFGGPNGSRLGHLGVDIAAPAGTPVYPVADGIVVYAKLTPQASGYGNVVIISHSGVAGITGIVYSVYEHLESIGTGIVPGAKVTRTMVVGAVGSTGTGAGPTPHLHLEIKQAADVQSEFSPAGTGTIGLPNTGSSAALGHAYHGSEFSGSVASIRDDGEPPQGDEFIYFNPMTFISARRPATSPGASATAFVFDVSGSMSWDIQGKVKIDQAKSAGHDVMTVIKNLSAKTTPAQVAIASFSNDAKRVQDLTSDYSLVDTAINQLTPVDQTDMGAGIEAGLDQLDAAPAGATKTLVLLSDGNTNQGLTADEIIAGPVKRAKDAGVKIYTIGFGDPNSTDENLGLNEDLLKQIAAETGGQYQRADATAVAKNLTSLFIRSQVSSTQNVLAEFEGAVAQGAVTKAGTFLVQRLTGLLQVVLNWPGSELELQLTDPSGKPVAAGYPGFTLSQGRPLQAFIENPADGEWQLSVYGKTVSATEEQFYALVSSETTTTTVPPTPGTGGTPNTAASTGGSAGGNNAAIWLGFLGVVVLVAIVLTFTTSRRRGPAEAAAVEGLEARPLGDVASPPSYGSPVSSTATGRATAVLVADDGSRFDLRPGTNSVGRSSRSDVVVSNPRTSLNHAEIVVGPSGAMVRDLSSTYGTLVNGERVFGERAVADGDQITFGSSTFVFRMPRQNW